MLDKLDIPPRGTDPFLWADYVELLAVTHADKSYSRGELDSVRRASVDRGYNFKTEETWRMIINFHHIRANDFGSTYPFTISDDADTIFLVDECSPAHTAYLNLLISSCMRNIPSKQQGVIARQFEQICYEVFSRLMPAGSEVRATWANGGAEAPYAGTLFEKMQRLADDIRCTPNFKQRDFKPNDRGDGGIDLVAWHPMADQREGMPIAFAQCGCSRDEWRFKQLEASYAKHHRHFPVMHPWATFYFLPLDLREMDCDWAYKSDIGAAIIVDRLRLLRLAENFQIINTIGEDLLINKLAEVESD